MKLTDISEHLERDDLAVPKDAPALLDPIEMQRRLRDMRATDSGFADAFLEAASHLFGGHHPRTIHTDGLVEARSKKGRIVATYGTDPNAVGDKAAWLVHVKIRGIKAEAGTPVLKHAWIQSPPEQQTEGVRVLLAGLIGLIIARNE